MLLRLEQPSSATKALHTVGRLIGSGDTVQGLGGGGGIPADAIGAPLLLTNARSGEKKPESSASGTAVAGTTEELLVLLLPLAPADVGPGVGAEVAGTGVVRAAGFVSSCCW